MDAGDYKKASTCYLIGNVFNKGIAFLTVPIFTRILSTSDYGIVTTYNSWIGIVTMLLGFALHMAIRSSFIDYREKVDEYLTSTLLFTVAFSVSMTVIVCSVSVLLNLSIPFILILLCMLQSMSSAIIEDYSYYLMMKFNYKFRTMLMIVPNLLSVVLSVLAMLYVFNTNRYLGRVIPTAIVTLFFGIFLVFLSIRRSGFVFNIEFLKHGLKISTPLILHGIALNILSQSDRTMITWLADASQTGIYSLIYNFSMIATVITTSLDGVWVPWFTKQMSNKGYKEINKVAVDYVNLMTYAMCCLIMVAPEVVKILASKPYWEGIVIIPPVVLSNYIIFVYTMYVNVEHYYKKTVRISLYTAVAAVINLVLNYIFIPYFGYVAAAYTTIVSYVVALILHTSYAKKLRPEIYPIKTFFVALMHGLGFEMKFPASWGYSIANSIGVSEDNYVCAAGHYSSPDLIKSYVYGLGFEYLKVSTKEQYLDCLPKIVSNEKQDRTLVVEIVVNSENEDAALNLIGSIMVDESNVAKAAIKKAIGKKGIDAIKKMMGR